MDPQLSLYRSREEIAESVAKVAARISSDYQGKRPVLVGVLKGSFVFLADLVRELDLPVSIEFVIAQRYSGEHSTGEVAVKGGSGLDVQGKDVLLVEDIVDTGTTTSPLLDVLESQSPASLKVCAMVDKPSRRVTAVAVDYVGFTVPDVFLVGYGMDLDQKWRELPEMYVFRDSPEE